MGRTSVRAAAVVTLAALFAGTATASFAAAPEEVNTPVPIDSPAGHYIVLLKDAPLATYDGGVARHRADQAGEGQAARRRTPRTRRSTSRTSRSSRRLSRPASASTPDTTYQVTLNGFAANLSGERGREAPRQQGRPRRLPRRDPAPRRRALDRVPRPRQQCDRQGRRLGARSAASPKRARASSSASSTPASRPRTPRSPGASWAASRGAEPYLDRRRRSSSRRPTAPSSARRASPVRTGASRRLHHEAHRRAVLPRGRGRVGLRASSTTSRRPATATATARTPRARRRATSACRRRSRASTSARSRASRRRRRSPRTRPATPGPTRSSPPTTSARAATCSPRSTPAVADGVDVINYSIGGGSATTVLQPEDISFFNAAAAGVFVAVSAGNSGPGASTADHASPWYTTVAASTIPTYEGTVTLPSGFKAVGASVSRARSARR